MIAARACTTLVVMAFAFPVVAETAMPVPDFAGTWGRNTFNLEAPASGRGPIRNLRRLGSEGSQLISGFGGGGDPIPLVGDYKDPLLKPQAAQVVKRMGEMSTRGHDIPDPSDQCAAYSPPFVLGMEQRVTVLQTKTGVTLYYAQDVQVRHIRLNASHPANLKPSPMGDSVGHYEGDTLVVDTVGIEVGPYTVVDRFGTPQSKAMHVVERYRLISDQDARAAQQRHEQVAGRTGGKQGNTSFVPGYPKGLQVHVTIDDPNTYTRPWSGDVTYRFTRAAFDERVCADNASLGRNLGIEHPPTAGKPDF
ncbi:MAG TPA: hypothetical protein VFW28_18900 [Micropepsaceae bacterium]|nr:hypothetical protein [Micropepsaceae bacterium]